MKTAINDLVTGQPLYSNIRAEAQAYGKALLRQYGCEHGCVCPPVSIKLTGRAARWRLGYYTVNTQTIVVHDGVMSDYGVRSTLVHELAHHIQHTCPLSEGNTTKAEPGSSHGTVIQVQHARLRALAAAQGLLPSLEEIDESLGEIVVRIHGLRRTSGEAILQIGRKLSTARERCRLIVESFEIFIEGSFPFPFARRLWRKGDCFVQLLMIRAFGDANNHFLFLQRWCWAHSGRRQLCVLFGKDWPDSRSCRQEYFEVPGLDSTLPFAAHSEGATGLFDQFTETQRLRAET